MVISKSKRELTGLQAQQECSLQDSRSHLRLHRHRWLLESLERGHNMKVHKSLMRPDTKEPKWIFSIS